jgi:hypothetical protein
MGDIMKTRFFIFAIVSAIFAVSVPLGAGQITGRTVGPEGQKPAKGIFAIASPMGESSSAKEGSRIIAVTGEDGTFSLSVPDGDKNFEIIITDKEKDGFIYWGFAHISKTEDLGVVELRKNCSLTGKVADEKNNPLSGATVKAEIRLKTCQHYANAAEAKTAADGSFEFNDLAPREYRISVDAENLFCEPAPISMTEDLNYIEFKMKPGCSAAAESDLIRLRLG